MFTLSRGTGPVARRAGGRARRTGTASYTLDEAGRIFSALRRTGTPSCPRCDHALVGVRGDPIAQGAELQTTVLLRCARCRVALTLTATSPGAPAPRTTPDPDRE